MPDICSSIKVILVFCCVAALGGCGGSGAAADSMALSVPVANVGTVQAPATGTPTTTSAPTHSNAAPILGGNPILQVSVGESYSFTPSVTDPNGNAVTFSAANVPRWARFDTTNGSLTGTPTAADVSSYPNILISANDGKASTSLTSFTITVVDSASGSATVSWFPPTQNIDGSALTNLAGYLIHYGRAVDNLNGTVKITNPSVNRYLVGNLAAGYWHFAVSAVNSKGLESSLSEIVSKTIY